MAPDIRTRTRDALRSQLSDAAFDVIAERGFDAVTVADLAEAVGISRATFFRYFGSKEDVVISAISATGAEFPSSLPIAHDVTDNPWALLRQLFEPAVLIAERAPERLRARLALVGSVPSLQARLAAHRQLRVDELAVLLVEKLGDEFTARIFAVTAMAALSECWQRWAADEQIPFRIILDAAFERLAGTLVPLEGPHYSERHQAS